MTKFAILLNGDLSVTERLLKQIDGAQVIAVDGGMGHADTLKVVPEIWIGDFDSSDPAMVSRWCDVERVEYPSDKNLSDGALAIDYCISHGATEIILVAGNGGRSDMVMSHQLQLIALARQNVNCFMTSGDEETWPLMAGVDLGRMENFEQTQGATISVVGFDHLAGLSIKGVKWPLQNRDVELGSTLTLSNVVCGQTEVSLQGGFGVVIVSALH